MQHLHWREQVDDVVPGGLRMKGVDDGKSRTKSTEGNADVLTDLRGVPVFPIFLSGTSPPILGSALRLPARVVP